jgi:hypothetical protein
VTKKSRKNKKPRPQPKTSWQIPNSMIKAVKLLDPEYYLQHAREYPILGCWIMEGWYEAGITPVIVAREQAPGKVIFASCMVDLTCLGIKDAYANADFSLAKFERELPKMCAFKPEKCSPELAHEVIYGAMEYAERYGFHPHPDFTAQMADLVLDPPDAHPRLDNVAFGKDGKPFYISGPYDNEYTRQNIFNTLMRTAGEGNFDYIVGLGGMPDEFDEDDFEDELDLDDDVRIV